MSEVLEQSNPHLYRVQVDWCPPYELLISLGAFVSRPDHKTLDLGTGWVRRVQKELPAELAEFLSRPEGLKNALLMEPLIWQCPGERDVESFLHWLATLSPGGLYELLGPYVADDHMPGAEPLPRDLAAARDRTLDILQEWNDAYFRHVDGAILEYLRADAAAKRALAGSMPPVDLVELATNGLHFTPDNVDLVVLAPQYHHRPWNIYAPYHRMWFYNYPADTPAAPGEPPAALLHLTHALSDESRLRILRYLAGGKRSFTEIVRFTGLSKSTVHHHTVALRAAGLVRVHEIGDRYSTYSLRPGAIDALRDTLRTYIEGSESQ